MTSIRFDLLKAAPEEIHTPQKTFCLIDLNRCLRMMRTLNTNMGIGLENGAVNLTPVSQS